MGTPLRGKGSPVDPVRSPKPNRSVLLGTAEVISRYWSCNKSFFGPSDCLSKFEVLDTVSMAVGKVLVVYWWRHINRSRSFLTYAYCEKTNRLWEHTIAIQVKGYESEDSNCRIQNLGFGTFQAAVCKVFSYFENQPVTSRVEKSHWAATKGLHDFKAEGVQRKICLHLGIMIVRPVFSQACSKSHETEEAGF